jgi:antitoxin FitA
MPSIQIKNVPEETHRVLRQRAAATHRSLQEYLLALLVEQASSRSIDEILDRAGQRAGGSLSLEEAAETVRADRASR